MKKNPKRIYFIFLGILLLLILGIITIPFGIGSVYGIITGLSERSNSLRWREHTQPISSEIAKELCDDFEINPDEPVCNHDLKVYGPDFYPFIVKAFCPKNNECVDINEVENKIGNYRYSEASQDSLMPDESNRYRYDFQTDHMYPLVITFYKNGIIKRIQYDFGN